MSEMIRYCSSDGYFKGSACPECSNKGDFVIDGDTGRSISQFMCGLLRHWGDEYGLDISKLGWVDIDAFICVVTDKYDVSEDVVFGILHTDRKGRYEWGDEKVRATYGHGNNLDYVEIDREEAVDVPNTIYHGTAPRFVDSISMEGIVPQSRSNVHLTASFDEAVSVGARHSNSEKVTVLHIDTGMLEDNHVTISNPPTNDELYVVDWVPPEAIIETELVDS